METQNDLGVYQKLHKERDFYSWLMFRASEQEIELYEKIAEYADDFFDDFLFKIGSTVDEYTKVELEDENGDLFDGAEEIPYAELRYFDEIVLKSLLYKVEPLEDDCVGVFNRLDYSITVTPESLKDKSVILHELIHIFESVIDCIPKFYHDILTISLYNHLRNTIQDLDSRIIMHTHVLFGEAITESGGDHDILFFLKSLDLDLRCGYKLGTVCGYGRVDFEE